VANGLSWFHKGELYDVETARLLAEESAKYAPDTEFNKNVVLVTAVNGAVGTVKVEPVYSAVPFTSLMLDTFPAYLCDVFPAIAAIDLEPALKFVTSEVVEPI
jgi:hypothetical protein